MADATTYGLSYAPEFLHSLPLVSPDNDPGASRSGAGATGPEQDRKGPRVLNASQFSKLHLKHTLAHAPDNVLFPFLHGIEGDNLDQNKFFASQSAVASHSDSIDSRKRLLAVPPKYRGLMWVLCEDDLDHPSQLGLLGRVQGVDDFSTTDVSSDDDFSDDDYDLDDEDDEMDDSSSEGFDDPAVAQMDVDVQVNIADGADSTDAGIDATLNGGKPDKDEKHMHPVQHRSLAPPIQTDLAMSMGPPSATDSTSGTLDSAVSPETSAPSPASTGSQHKKLKSKSSLHRKLGKKAKVSPIPSLTCSFRERDIIKQCAASSEWEFRPLQVPAGISLRNFGIQVPIVSSLSDFVVYSPKGCTTAACALAHRLQNAIDKKRKERSERLGSDDDLLQYNVFVLDATAEQIDREMHHLVARLNEGSSNAMHRPLIDDRASPRVQSPLGTDFEMDMDMDTDGDAQMSGSTATLSSPPHLTDRRGHTLQHAPNTVDFAQREREEMRDLTRASEIVSVFPPSYVPRSGASTAGMDLSSTSKNFEPMVGQVFLGNSNDVPMCMDNRDNLELSWDMVSQLSRTRTPSNESQSTTGDSPPMALSESPCSSVASLENGNLVDVQSRSVFDGLPPNHPLNHYTTNLPANGMGYDVCIECHDMAPFPSVSMLRAAEEKVDMLETLWRDRHRQVSGQDSDVPPRPPPHANSVIHLPFPSSPPSTNSTMSSLMPVIRFIEKCLSPPSQSSESDSGSQTGKETTGNNRRWSSVASLLPNFASFPLHSTPSTSGQSASRMRSFTTPSSAPTPSSMPQQQRVPWSRPLKVLLYSADGYTESSVPALCLLMAVKNLSLPEAYLELQVVKRRSFFVYQGDLGVLRRVESRMTEERRDRENQRRDQERLKRERERSMSVSTSVNPYAAGASGNWGVFGGGSGTPSDGQTQAQDQKHRPLGRPAAKSVSFAQTSVVPPRDSTPYPPEEASSPVPVPSSQETHRSNSESTIPLSTSLPGGQSMLAASSYSHTIPKARRARASTSPWLPSLFGGDHQSWFNDPRFEGSFPSRVLPFLYLGNLAHASNAYMLHALGITHVVSVGECALVPPPNMQALLNGPGEKSMHFTNGCPPSSHSHFVKGPGNQGSLWIEERAGRIKVLDIQGVCDDGIDTLEPQLEPICEWIDKARREGGHVLVHCRVGVSRSATVTIAYVMKHLSIPLVDAYLIVRSRRLSVLIQPNMRLLYNLCGWEIKLAKERAGNDEHRLQYELSTALTWPYLAKEVHKLNEKYLVH